MLPTLTCGLSCLLSVLGIYFHFLPLVIIGGLLSAASGVLFYARLSKNTHELAIYAQALSQTTDFYVLLDPSFNPKQSNLPPNLGTFPKLLALILEKHPDFSKDTLENFPSAIEVEAGNHYFLVNIKPLHSQDCLWIIQEIHIPQEALMRKYELMNEVIEGSPIGILSTYPNGKIFAHNQMFIDQINKVLFTNTLPPFEHNLKDHDFISLINTQSSSASLDKLNQFLAGDPVRGPVEVYFLKDEKVAFNIYLSSISHTEKLSTFYVVDISDHKQLSQQLSQSQKMQAIGQLAGGIAHDFNNLLTAMIGYCDLLLLRHSPTDLSFNDIMQIKQNANRAAILVRQLLAFSRQQTLQPKVIDVTEILAELSILLQRLIGPTIILQVVHARDLWLVKVDQGQLEQVIMNLAVNARDAMVDGGNLIISTGNFIAQTSVHAGHETMPPGDYIYIKVEDSGVGIPPENLNRIFDPFFSTKPIGAGTGLGLSTVYGIVKQTGGYVTVESTVGRGTLFSIYLPKNNTVDAQAATATSTEPSHIADLTGTATILLVEDEDAVRLFSARALRDKGYNVLDASSGHDALRLIEDYGRPVDLVVTDVVMAPMDGPTLASRLCEKIPNVKIIFISGYTEDSFRNQLKENTHVHFLPKPFSLKDLARKVKQVLNL
jgi:two-component system cell cycle sensor histidine kinase/response regulator CckA